jgi:ribosomal protein L37AE/L43A
MRLRQATQSAPDGRSKWKAKCVDLSARAPREAARNDPARHFCPQLFAPLCSDAELGLPFKRTGIWRCPRCSHAIGGAATPVNTKPDCISRNASSATDRTEIWVDPCSGHRAMTAVCAFRHLLTRCTVLPLRISKSSLAIKRLTAGEPVWSRPPPDISRITEPSGQQLVKSGPIHHS